MFQTRMTKKDKLDIISEWFGKFPCTKFFKDYGGGCIVALWSEEEMLDLIEKRIEEEKRDWVKCDK
ncbi:hypothetical protein LCGC14_1242350 [marine sediment metagenome]|uniref:Uncharacterized protein n=1 Tax=marine sediment metagenome TaxID=412755 RepID=A0A0F9L5I5_9ZZZZ